MFENNTNIFTNINIICLDISNKVSSTFTTRNSQKTSSNFSSQSFSKRQPFCSKHCRRNIRFGKLQSKYGVLYSYYTRKFIFVRIFNLRRLWTSNGYVLVFKTKYTVGGIFKICVWRLEVSLMAGSISTIIFLNLNKCSRLEAYGEPSYCWLIKICATKITILAVLYVLAICCVRCYWL